MKNIRIRELEPVDLDKIGRLLQTRIELDEEYFNIAEKRISMEA